MRKGLARLLSVLAVGLCLAGCSVTDGSLSDKLGLSSKPPPAADDPASAAMASSPLGPNAADPGLLGANPYDDLSIGKRYYHAGNFGMAERYFRKAVELHPRDAEAWLDLAAAYDRLRRFDLADRAYTEAAKIVGPTVEILNNEGYSYMLRGDFVRARAKLDQAQRHDPANRFVANNLRLLAVASQSGKALQ